MADEEGDYMSDVFLKNLETAEQTTGVGGQKRKRQPEQRPSKQKLHELQHQRRDEGLSTPIAADTKGTPSDA